MKHTKAAAVVAGLVMALGTAAPAMADSGAEGYSIGSPGLLSGNVVQVPIDLGANLCGNSLSVLGLLSPAVGNACLSD
ncbi:chaplin [Streptomyces sp. 5K101]|uniref:chaplin n=1 Tax=Streptomyces sp. 5K101 TaxID=3390037 RepID=UPI003976ABB7